MVLGFGFKRGSILYTKNMHICVCFCIWRASCQREGVLRSSEFRLKCLLCSGFSAGREMKANQRTSKKSQGLGLRVSECVRCTLTRGTGQKL